MLREKRESANLSIEQLVLRPVTNVVDSDGRQARGEQLRHVKVALVKDVVAQIRLLVDEQGVNQWVPVSRCQDCLARLKNDIAFVCQIEAHIFAEVIHITLLGQLDELGRVFASKLCHVTHLFIHNLRLLEDNASRSVHWSPILVTGALLGSRSATRRFLCFCVTTAHLSKDRAI